MPNLYVNGYNLKQMFEVYVTNAGIYESPTPEYETVQIEGRNGDLIYEKNRYSNIRLRYPAVIYRNFDYNYAHLKSFLLSLKGYVRVADDIELYHYRLGRFMSDLSPKYPRDAKMGTFEINFWCKPQWYLISGESATTFTSTGTIDNPTAHPSKPLIRIYGAGQVGIGSKTITVSSGATNFVDVDCEIMDCYEGSVNRNNLVSMTEWPTLNQGINNISLGTGITKVQITPRWFDL